MKVPVSPHPGQHFLSFYFFFDNSHPNFVWSVTLFGFDVIFLMTNDAEPLFICLLAICTSLDKCLYTVFAHFKIGCSISSIWNSFFMCVCFLFLKSCLFSLSREPTFYFNFVMYCVYPYLCEADCIEWKQSAVTVKSSICSAFVTGWLVISPFVTGWLVISLF